MHLMPHAPAVRNAQPPDIEQLLPLWASLFEEDPSGADRWRHHACDWFHHAVTDPTAATFPVVEREGRIAACAVGILQLVAPNPQCPTGRAVHLMNVVTDPAHRGRGYATALTEAVVRWARSIGADRVDLNASPEGQRVYERAGFTVASAPRMKLPL